MDEQTHRFLTGHFPRRQANSIRWHIDNAHWFRDLPVTAGAQEGVQEMLDVGWDVWVCTKPLEANVWCRDDKAAWLREHFPMIPEPRLILASDKSMILGDILLDDAIKPSWVPRAHWAPVTFLRPFNGPGTEHHFGYDWTWGDRLGRLCAPFRGVSP